MNIEVKSFYDYADKCKKFYSVHGKCLYCNTYKEAITRSGSVYELHKEDVNKDAEKQFHNYYKRLKLEYIN